MSFSTILKSKIFSIVLGGLVVWLGLLAIRIYSHEGALQAKLELLSRKAEETSQANKDMEQRIEYAQNPAFLEKEAREKLNMKRADEEVLFIYRTTEPAPQKVASESLDEPDEDLPRYKKWLYDVFGW